MPNELDDLDDLEPTPQKGAKAKKKPIEVKKEPSKRKITMEFDDDVDAQDIQKTMDMAAKLTTDQVEKRQSTDAGREAYRKNGHRRWRCMVESTDGRKFFDLTVPHPQRDTPIMVQGVCGKIIEDGLPQYAIDCLNRAYLTKQQEVAEQDRRGDIGLTTRTIKIPLFRVTMYEEIENPKELGKVGA